MNLSHYYIALSDKNFDFEHWEVDCFDTYFNEGLDLYEIAKRLQRSTFEMFLLYLDRVDKGKVKPTIRLQNMGGR